MSPATTILVVEDEEAIRQLVCFSLEKLGYRCVPVADARAASVAISDQCPDLILLDWMLPGMSGFELTRQLKTDRATGDIPVILLTARGAEQDKVRGLDAGADDYVTKPFSMAELASRVNAVLRRSAPQPAEGVIEIDGLRVDTEAHRVETAEGALPLSPTEFRLLVFFVKHPERVHSRTKLLDEVWGDNVYVDERTVDVHIRRLRKALSPSGHDRLVQTVRGAGYRLSVRD